MNGSRFRDSFSGRFSLEVQLSGGFAFSINSSLSARKALHLEGNWFAAGLWNCFLDLWFIDSSIWEDVFALCYADESLSGAIGVLQTLGNKMLMKLSRN